MILPVFLPHMGCGQRCTYCNQDIITDETCAVALEDRLASLFAPLRKSVEAAFYGGDPLGLSPEDLERLLAALAPYRDRITGVRISAKPRRWSVKTIGILKRHGVTTIELGIPCFNDRILGALNRGHTAADLVNAHRHLKDEGFQIGLQVMVGLPGETYADLEATAASIAALAPAFIRIYPLCVIEDTPLFARFRDGDFQPDSLETAVTKAAYLYVAAWGNGISTIKMGLTDSGVLRRKVAAGPYHPAFGYLVKSEAFFLAVLRVCTGNALSGEVQVLLNRRDIPHLVGPKRSNILRFREKGIEPVWSAAEMPAGCFAVTAGGRKVSGSLTDALAMIPV
jgi:histone acetyltransferase (RNA polymerase elongator complex component)